MTIGDRAAAIVRETLGSHIFALAQMQAEVEALRAENNELKQRVAQLEVQRELWQQTRRTVPHADQ